MNKGYGPGVDRAWPPGKAPPCFGGETAAAFAPTDVAGLKIWAEARLHVDPTAFGDAGLAQLVGAGGGTPANPSYTASDGGFPAMLITAADSEYFSANSVALTTSVAFVGFRNDTASRIIYAHTTNGFSGDGQALFSGNSSTISSVRSPGGLSWKQVAPATSQFEANVKQRARHEVGGTNALHKLFIADSEVSYAGNSNTDDPGSASVSDTIYVGARAGTSLFLNGAIYYYLLYSPIPSTSEITDIESYLATNHAF